MVLSVVLTFDVAIVLVGGAATVTVVERGTGFVVDETITILDTTLGGGGTGIATVDTVGAADASRAEGSYTIGVNDYTATGSGLGAQFSVVVDANGAATVGVTSGGSGYAIDDTITIQDAQLGSGGGAALTFDVATLLGAADLTFDVASLTGSTATVDVSRITAANALTGFRTKFENDLRPGEVITPTVSDVEGNNTVRIERVNPLAIATTATNKKSTVSAGDEIFN